MRFCKECYELLEDDQSFCPECGSEHPDYQSSQDEEELRYNTRHLLSKRTKWVIWIAGVFGVLFIGLHLFLTFYFDPMKDFRGMERAIIEDDVTAFMEYIEQNDAALMDEKSYFEFIKYEEWEGIKEQFLHLTKENENAMNEIIYSNNGGRLFHLKKESILWFYHTYSFQAVPTRFIISANMERTEVSIDGITHTLETMEPTELMWVYPGKYTVQAYANNNFGEFTYEEEVNIYPSEEYEYSIGFLGKTYHFSTNKNDAYLYINGENTGVTFAELDELGPFPDGANPELHGVWENAAGEMIETAVMTLADNELSGLDFYFVENNDLNAVELTNEEAVHENSGQLGELGQYLASIVVNFRNDYETALNNKDFSLIADYLLTDSIVFRELRDYIAALKDSTYQFDFKENNVWSVVSMEDGSYIVTTNEKFTFTNHLDQEIDYERMKEYILIESGETYRIMEINYVETKREY